MIDRIAWVLLMVAAGSWLVMMASLGVWVFIRNDAVLFLLGIILVPVSGLSLIGAFVLTVIGSLRNTEKAE